jgi:hypothetical protein
MTAAKKKLTESDDESEAGAVDAVRADAQAMKEALLRLPIPHAYALIPVPERPGRFYAVHLTNVTAMGLEHLEPSGRSEAAAYGLGRIGKDMEKRHKEKGWAK